jgi:ribosomal protein S18 acetylase RimI-like enzyme
MTLPMDRSSNRSSDIWIAPFVRGCEGSNVDRDPGRSSARLADGCAEVANGCAEVANGCAQIAIGCARIAERSDRDPGKIISMPIRDYRPADMDACVAIIDTIWRFHERLEPNALADCASRLYVGGSLSASDCAWVLEDEDAVRGSLFGRTGSGEPIMSDYRGIGGTLRMVLDFLRLPGLGPRAKGRWLRAIHDHAANRARIEPEADGEVTLFAVDPAAQGRGFGRRLMDRYLERCRAAGVQRIVVETDRDSSYGFYDRYGFERLGRFDSPMNRLFTGSVGDAYLYLLAL